MENTYYILKYNAPEHGFFSHFLYVIGGTNYCLNNNLLPCVDWTHLTLSYLDKDVPIYNPFEYYFEQKHTLDVAYSKNHIISPKGFPWEIWGDFHVPTGKKIWYDKILIKQLYSIFESNFKFKEEILLSSNEKIKKNKTLGVHCRRTDMVAGHPSLFMIHDLDETFNKVNRIFEMGSFEYLYLATEEVELLEYFKSKFGDKIIYQECWRAEPNMNQWAWFHYEKNNRKYHNYLKGKEVLIDSINLSNCESLICSISGVSYGSIIFNNTCYSQVYYFDEI